MKTASLCLLWSLGLPFVASYGFLSGGAFDASQAPLLNNVNATDTVTIPGWDLANLSNKSSGQWSYHLAIGTQYNNHTSSVDVFYETYVTTNPTQDFQADNLTVAGCGITLGGWSLAVNRRAAKANGDCTSFMSSTCISDVRRSLQTVMQEATQRDCNMFADFFTNGSNIPASCRSAIGTEWPYVASLGLIGPGYKVNGTGNKGDGKLNGDILFTNVEGSETGYAVGYTGGYDYATTDTFMVISTIWTNSTKGMLGSDESDSKLVCLRAKDFTPGSRVPPGVPSSASRFGPVGWFFTAFLALLLI